MRTSLIPARSRVSHITKTDFIRYGNPHNESRIVRLERRGMETARRALDAAQVVSSDFLWFASFMPN